jgi:hypothetical protein
MAEDHRYDARIADVREIGMTQTRCYHAHQYLAATGLAHIDLVELWRPPAFRENERTTPYSHRRESMPLLLTRLRVERR